MGEHTKIGAIAVVLVISAFSAYSYISKPKTYEDCVLANIGKAENEISSRLVRSSCREKFPGKEEYTYEEIFGGATKQE